MIRVLVADDHPLMRQGLTALLDSLDGIHVVAQATNGHEAVREAVLHRPDVILLDLQMPDADGFTALREISRALPGTPVCVLTMFSDDDSLFTAMRAGASSYLLKGAEQEDIERAVRGVAAGEAVFGPGVAQRVLTQLTAPPRAREPFPQLTPREREVLDLLAGGRPPKDISTTLGLAPKTISNTISSILTKLQVTDRAQATIIARDAGLGTPSTDPTSTHESHP
ncbi:MAG: response regulator transcription factor [Nocardioides sp.]